VTRPGDFKRAYQRRARRDVGCLVVYAVANGGPLPRLGLSVGRVVGGAVERNALKRRLREAFRLEQRDLPAGWDLVVVARPHALRSLADYRALLRKASAELVRAPGTGS
jgi:ribonuclease P protein component